jgi:hypothetical protein
MYSITSKHQRKPEDSQLVRYLVALHLRAVEIYTAKKEDVQPDSEGFRLPACTEEIGERQDRYEKNMYPKLQARKR